MRLTKNQWIRAGKWMGVCLIGMAWASLSYAQAFSTTTVQGTVYLANGMPGAGTLQLSWPAFTTANNQAVTAGRATATIGADGFVSVNLAANLGSTPAGLFYTAVYHMSDGTTSTEYWVVPAAAQATIAQVRSQVMPAAQAVHAVSKAYVDQAIQSLSQSSLAPSGGTLSGPLYLNGDPEQAMQAADKHYVDSIFSEAVPLTGAALTGPLTSVQLGAAYQVDQFPGADFGAKLQACLGAISSIYGGTCDARNFTGSQSMASNLTIATANTTVMLPCATISTANQVIVPAGTRNVALHGCALRGASNASGSQGGTAFMYSGTRAMVQVGDPTYAADTMGFHLDNVVINTTASNNSTAQGLTAYRTQEMDLQSLYLLGNSNQTGMTLDGTGNYTGGTFYDTAFNGFQTAVNAIGHQVSNSATTDWLNASTFVRLHIDCPTSGGNPISGTYGINLQQGDGNTFTGGDVEGCNTALHLGSNAQNNTIVGLRNENSNSQVVADSGSSYNNWMTGGTMFTGKLADNGTRNSFLDTFHRSFNGMNGDWYGSQQDATVTNHYRLGIGSGNERGMLNRYQTDYGYRWTMGLSDATAGEQFYQVLDELNNVYRLSIGQYSNGQPSSNNQTAINAAGTGAVVLNGSNNSGTGGVVIGSGGAAETTVATINNAGNAQFNGTLQVGSASTFAGSTTVRNQADAEIDAFLWAGATANQKESFTYKDNTGGSQWYMVKDASNDWALNSATGGLDSFKAYQSSNSGDTYINASNPLGVVRVNYESGAGTGFNIYGGNSSTLFASFAGTTTIKFPGLAASSGHNCLQIDNSGYITNTGAACGSGSGSGTVNSGASGQIAYYNGTGTALSGMSAIPITAGGTGATSAAEALTSLGAASLTAASTQSFAGPIAFSSGAARATQTNLNGSVTLYPEWFGAVGDGVHDDTAAIQAAWAACPTGASAACTVHFAAKTYLITSMIDIAGTGSGIQRNMRTMSGEGKGTTISCSPSATIEACIRILNGSFSTIKDLSIISNSYPTYGLEITTLPESTENVTLDSIWVNGGVNGIGVGPDTGNDVSHVIGHSVITDNVSNAGWVIGNGTQANVLDHYCYGCESEGNAIGIKLNGGGMGWYGGVFEHNSQEDVLLAWYGGQNNVFEGVRSEGSNRFFASTIGAGNNAHIGQVSIRDVSAQTMASDHHAIIYNIPLPLVISNSSFTDGTGAGLTDFQIGGTGPGGTHPLNVSLTNVNTDNPAWPSLLAGWEARADISLFSVNDAYQNASGAGGAGSGRMYLSGIPIFKAPFATDSSGNLTTGGSVTATGNLTTGGSVAATGNLTAGGNVTATGSVSANSFSTTVAGIGLHTNLVPYSQFDASSLGSSWKTLSLGSSTITANAAVDPYGNTDAETIATDSLSNTWMFQYQAGSGITAETSYAVSVWMRGHAGGESVQFGFGQSTGYQTNPLTLTTTWQRYCAVIVPPTAPTQVFDFNTTSKNSSIDLWGAQTEPGTFCGTYTHTAGSQVIGAQDLVVKGQTVSVPLVGTTASIGGSALAAGACSSDTVTVGGASVGMGAAATPSTYPGDGMMWNAYVSAANIVTVKVCADVAGTPFASVYNVRVNP